MKNLRHESWYSHGTGMGNIIIDDTSTGKQVCNIRDQSDKERMKALDLLITYAPNLLDAAIAVNREFDDENDAQMAFRDLSRVLKLILK